MAKTKIHRHTIHTNIRSHEDIFDIRDPSPVSRRKLSPDWLDYVFDALDGIPRRQPVNLTLQLRRGVIHPSQTKALVHDVRRQLHHYHRSLRHKLRQNFRAGRTTLFLGLLVLVGFVFLSEASTKIDLGDFQLAFREGFLIIGWVALWRPVEILLYDWWPIVESRRKVGQLLKGTITVTHVGRKHKRTKRTKR